MNPYTEFTAESLQFETTFGSIMATDTNGQVIYIGCNVNVGKEIASCFPSHPIARRIAQPEQIKELAQTALANHPYNIPCPPIEPYAYSSDVGLIVLYRATSSECTSTVKDIVYQPAGKLDHYQLVMGEAPTPNKPLHNDMLGVQRDKIETMGWADIFSSEKIRREIVDDPTLRKYLAHSDFIRPFVKRNEAWLFTKQGMPPYPFQVSLAFVDKLFYSLHYLAEHGGSVKFFSLKRLYEGTKKNFYLDTSPRRKIPPRAWTTVAMNPHFRPS